MDELMKNQYIGLQTTYHTPHVCGTCMAHIADDWSFCPDCGTPTGITQADYEESQKLLRNLEDKMHGKEATP